MCIINVNEAYIINNNNNICTVIYPPLPLISTLCFMVNSGRRSGSAIFLDVLRVRVQVVQLVALVLAERVEAFAVPARQKTAEVEAPVVVLMVTMEESEFT